MQEKNERLQMEGLPLISIITVNFNDAAGLEKTAQSVFQQTYPHLEYIIIDGGSTDGSKKVIEQIEHKLSYCVSEQDTGIYNAMNKGIRKAVGDYLLFMNAGDVFTSGDVLNQMVLQSKNQDLIYGDIQWIENGEEYPGVFPETLTFGYLMFHSLPHQGTLIRRTVFEEAGYYDEDRRIISDWVFFLLAVCKHNCSYGKVPVLVARCDRHGISCKPENLAQIVQEKEEVLQLYFPAFYKEYLQLKAAEKKLAQVSATLGFRLHNAFNRLTGRHYIE